MMPQGHVRKHRSNSPKEKKSLSLVYREKYQRKSSEKQLNQAKKELPGYIKYIEGEKSDKQCYYASCDFDHLRDVLKVKAAKKVDLKNGKIVGSIIYCIQDNLKAKKPLSSLLIQEYCFIFFSSFDKAKVEVVLLNHFFKPFASKIHPLFVYLRIVMFFVYLLAKKEMIYQEQFFKPVSEALIEVQSVYEKLVEVTIMRCRHHSKQRISQIFPSLTHSAV